MWIKSLNQFPSSKGLYAQFGKGRASFLINLDVIADSDGNVPVWEAMLGGHEAVAKLLIENGASINFGDVGHFACTAAEQNSLNLLKEIVRYGGDVTSPRKSGTTALHVAVCEDNTEIVRFLLEQGADIDKPDIHGWTPRDLADQQGHEEIKFIFQTCKEPKAQPVVTIPENNEPGIRYLGRFTSEPTIRPVSRDGSFSATDGSWSQSRPRRRTNNYHNSLFGLMSAAHKGEKESPFPVGHIIAADNYGANPPRVIISCPEKVEIKGKLVLLPKSLRELAEIGAKKFGLTNAKVLSKERAEIDDIEVIRDGDHILIASDQTKET